jgi:hypothetical protein
MRVLGIEAPGDGKRKIEECDHGKTKATLSSPFVAGKPRRIPRRCGEKAMDRRILGDYS